MDADGHNVMYAIQTRNDRGNFKIDNQTGTISVQIQFDDTVPRILKLVLVATDNSPFPKTWAVRRGTQYQKNIESRGKGVRGEEGGYDSLGAKEEDKPYTPLRDRDFSSGVPNPVYVSSGPRFQTSMQSASGASS